MSIWKLTPLNPLEAIWEGMFYSGEIVIRAPSKTNARCIAAHTFGGHMGGKNPWRDRNRVRAVRADYAAWPEHGPTKILYPLGFETDYSNVRFPEK